MLCADIWLLQSHPDGTPNDLLHSLQDLGYFRSEAKASSRPPLESLKLDPREALMNGFEVYDYDKVCAAVLVAAGCCWVQLVLVLLVAAGCCWVLLGAASAGAAGCCWLLLVLLVAASSELQSLVATGFITLPTTQLSMVPNLTVHLHPPAIHTVSDSAFTPAIHTHCI